MVGGTAVVTVADDADAAAAVATVRGPGTLEVSARWQVREVSPGDVSPERQTDTMDRDWRWP